MGEKVAVFGAGSWGTAFSIVLADAGHDVTIWGRREEVCAQINEQHENGDYLPGVELPPNIGATHDPEKAAHGAQVVVLAVPSQTLRGNLTEWAPALPSDSVLVSLMKGVELGSLKRMSQVMAELTGAGPERIAVVSGPNLSKEIARREPAASVVACEDEEVSRRLRKLIHCRAFRPYSSTDVVGCELGGAYKNVVGLAVGMAVGLGFGDNSTASVITRGLAETARLATALGANPMTLMGLWPASAIWSRRAPPRSPQPHVRGEARAGDDHRGDPRLDPASRRGRQVVLVAASPGHQARRVRADRGGGRSRGGREDDGAADDGGVHRQGHQGRGGLSA